MPATDHPAAGPAPDEPEDRVPTVARSRAVALSEDWLATAAGLALLALVLSGVITEIPELP